MHYPTNRLSGGTDTQSARQAGVLDLQGTLREIIKGVLTIGRAAGWQRKDMGRGRINPAHTLGVVLDELIDGGGDLHTLLEIPTAFEAYIRARVALRDGTCGTLAETPLTRVFAVEAAVQGATDNAQWAAVDSQSPAALQRALHFLRLDRAEKDVCISHLVAKLAHGETQPMLSIARGGAQ